MSSGASPLVDIDRTTGELIQGWPRCRQSIQVILTTRLRTRLMRLWWGSEFLDAQDKPNNQSTYAMTISAALHAIDQYEPEFLIDRCIFGGAGVDGSAEITIEGQYLPDKTSRSITVSV